MKTYVDQIIAPYFGRMKAKLGYPPDQTCIVQLNAWSVHRSLQFCTWVCKQYLWIVLDFIPANCTGIWQCCNVGIQWPFKQAVHHTQLEDMVAKTVEHLENHVMAAKVQLDKKIGALHNHHMRWSIKAYNTIQNLQFNLLFDSVTSSDAVDELLDLKSTDPSLWAELKKVCVTASLFSPYFLSFYRLCDYIMMIT
jgi:hypothetical protein